MATLDEDAVIAAAELVGRVGARAFEIGYFHRGPAEAAEALARRILTGAMCKCGRLVALSDLGAVAYDTTLADGTTWTAEQAAAAGQCRWRRLARRWEPGCSAPPLKKPQSMR